jgi:hypothetical protein
VSWVSSASTEASIGTIDAHASYRCQSGEVQAAWMGASAAMRRTQAQFGTRKVHRDSFQAQNHIVETSQSPFPLWEKRVCSSHTD